MRRMEGNGSKPNCLLLVFYHSVSHSVELFFVVLCVASQQRASHKYTIALTDAALCDLLTSSSGINRHGGGFEAIGAALACTSHPTKTIARALYSSRCT